MKSFIVLLATLLAIPLCCFAQSTISGTITDAEDQQPLQGANIIIKGTQKATSSDAAGTFLFENIKPGTYTVQISYIGYETVLQAITAGTEISIALPRSVTMTDEVIVSSTRASEKSAVAYTNVKREELEKINLGQDLPVLLRFTPSVVTDSDAGAGIGYTGIRIRGSGGNRINVTVNGIPLNDAESHGVFWVNMPDFASSVDNIQIQRGVGTSTNGAGAFGASINVQTTSLEKEPYAVLSNSAGSFNTFRHSLRAGTGLMKNGWAVDARLSKISSDGYIDRASSDLKSFFVSAGHYGEKSLLKFTVFSGVEHTYQAWEGVPQELLKSNRTFNPYTYENETDNYQQDHYQLHYSRELTPSLTLNTALHYTYGRGYYEQFKENRKFTAYDLPNIVLKDTTIKRTDLIQQRWLDNDFFGATYSLNYTAGKLTSILGGGINRYDGDHFGEVIWAKYASTGNIRHRYYDNKGLKDDFNIYSKTFYQFTEKLNAFIDLQYRAIDFSVNGIDNNRRELSVNQKFRFFNPKAGFTYQLNDISQVYASYSVANREPTRSNFTDAPAGRIPTSENLKNLEAGYKLQTDQLSFGANYYYMNYKNQLIMTGELNDVGSPIMVNVPKSYRTGIELEAAAKLGSFVAVGGNITLSQNKIAAYEERTQVYDEEYTPLADTSIFYKNTDISFSPNIIAASNITLFPAKGLELALLSKFVGDQYMDNTSDPGKKLNRYFVNDFRAGYTFSLPFVKTINASLLVNNIFNYLYEPNGYTYTTLFRSGDVITPVTSNFYYPQAGRNFLVSLTIGI